jgi:hypothetical protein
MAATQDPSPFAASTPTGVQTHPQYLYWVEEWRRLRHCYEGTGGFLDGTYLVAHPREWKDHQKAIPTEPTPKLLRRRELARYENLAQALVNQLCATLTREQPTRQIGGESQANAKHPLFAWWQNVDARGTHIDDYMKQAWIPSSIFGSTVHVMDRPVGPRPLTKADEKAPYLCWYTPLAMVDWLTDRHGSLTEVLLLEAVERKSLTQKVDATSYQLRHITPKGFSVQRYATKGKNDPLEGDHRLPTLPVVQLFAQRRAMSTVLGSSILGHSKLYVDDFNLTSELRELLRAQTFGWLNIVLGTGPDAVDVQTVKTMNDGEASTSSVLFSPAASSYIQPSAENIKSYQEERKLLRREMFRAAHVMFENDSRDAEAEGALKLKREDMNQVLSTYAAEMQKAEYAFVDLWFQFQYGQSWKEKRDEAQVVIRYPNSFDPTPFAELLEQIQAAQTIDIGPTAMSALRKQIVGILLPDLPATDQQAIFDEIEKLSEMKAEQDKQTAEARIKGMVSRARGIVDDTGQAAA